MTVLDAAGGTARELPSGFSGAGTLTVPRDGRDGQGRPVPGGVYVCRLDGSGRSAAAVPMLLAR